MVTNKIIQQAQRILTLEIKGLEDLRQSLDSIFVDVCNLILSCKGKVIVTGMGKSGHIANKIAATFASTGTSAFFVHPAEALHGDLGMIGENDIVIAISNSGNTPELLGIINYTQRFRIPLVAITTDKDSGLGRSSNFCLLLPKSEEACALGLAPTTSTTNALALGDALAITLLELKGFTPSDFRVFHPGGILGAKLVKVMDIMHKGEAVPLITSGSKMSEAIIIITSHRFGCVGVINSKGKIIGIITDGDIRRNMQEDFLQKKVDDVMTKTFFSVQESENTAHTILLMNDNKITSLFVLDKGKPVGIVHIHDLLKLGVI